MSAHRSFVPRVLVRGEESGGAVAIVELTVPPRWEGPPLHHHAFDEAFYVLEGELTFQLGGDRYQGTPGGFAFAPGGEMHTLANLSDAPARYLLAITPAGFERYFDPGAGGPVPETVVVGPQITTGGDRTLPRAQQRINVLLRGAESAGRVALTDNRVRSGGGPPLHHHAFDEAFYVLEGELTFQLGDERFVRRAGGLAFVPGGAHHTFANLSGSDARTLIVITPAGFERYFEQMAAREAGVEPRPEAREPWPETVKVGPPLA